MKLWRFDVSRSGVSIVALVVLSIFLMGTTLSEVEKRREADRARDRLIADIQDSNDAIAALVAQYLVRIDAATAAAEEAGKQVSTTREELLQSLRDVLPAEVIEEAIEIAAKGGPQGPPGPQGQPGRPGPPGAPEGNSTTTSTAPATTTSTTRAPTTTTTTTTTTTRPCTLGLLDTCILR